MPIAPPHVFVRARSVAIGAVRTELLRFHRSINTWLPMYETLPFGWPLSMDIELVTIFDSAMIPKAFAFFFVEDQALAEPTSLVD